MRMTGGPHPVTASYWVVLWSVLRVYRAAVDGVHHVLDAHDVACDTLVSCSPHLGHLVAANRWALT
jgi:hypothetical protein